MISLDICLFTCSIHATASGKVGTARMSEKGEKSTGRLSATGKEAFKTSNPGWATMQSTSAFRAINFELFVRPNKVVMAVGATLFLGSLGYIAYMNLNDDKTKNTYVTLDADDDFTSRPKVSKWE